MSLHSICAVTPVVHRSRNSHNQRRNSITHHVEIAFAWVLALEHLHEHDVELHSFQEHPGERSQEEEVEQGGEDGTGNLWKGGKDLQGNK